MRFPSGYKPHLLGGQIPHASGVVRQTAQCRTPSTKPATSVATDTVKVHPMYRQLNRIQRLVALGAVALMVLSGCGSDASVSSTRTLPPTAIPVPAGVGAAGEPLVLEVVDGGEATGLVVTDYRGMALYGVSGESPANLICVDECTTTWIPLTADGRTGVSDRLDSSRVGSVLRPDGTTQVTYADVPLYRWTGDDSVGVTGGAGVAGIWFAITQSAGFIE